MARTRMITRTITTTAYTVLCMDVSTASPERCIFIRTGDVMDNETALKELRKKEETDTYKLVAITSIDTTEELYGMEEDLFRAYADKLDIDTRKPIL